MTELPLPVVVALLMSLGAACQWVAWRTDLPAILYLLICGLAIGTLVGTPEAFGISDAMLFPFVSLGVAIILFEGSLTLKFAEVRGVTRIIRNLLTIGVLVSWAGMTLGSHYLLEFEWPLALLFGAIVTVTGPTVIVPLLRSLQPTARIANVLRWEGILIDPLGALLAVLVYTAVASGSGDHTVPAFALSVAVGVGFGLVGAFSLGQIIRRHLAPEYLLNYLSLAMVLMVFVFSNQIAHEAGLLAVTVMGIALANMHGVNMRGILDFKEHLTIVIISLMFILLAARVDAVALAKFGIPALGILALAQFVVRPLAVALSSIGTTITLREGTLLAWIGPRGIVAAAVSSLFALELTQAGVANAELLAPAVFIIIVGTVVIESATAKPLAKALGLAQSGSKGALIIGANDVSVAVAAALNREGIPVLIADHTWGAIREARMAGIPTYFGNPLSEHADVHLDTTGLNRLFIMRRHPEQNALAYTHFRPHFGAENIYALANTGEEDNSKRQLALQLRARPMFGADVSWIDLARRLNRDSVIRSTKITEDFSLDDFSRTHGADFLPLFIRDADGNLQVFAGGKLPEGSGWTLISVVRSEAKVAESRDSGPPKLPKDHS